MSTVVSDVKEVNWMRPPRVEAEEMALINRKYYCFDTSGKILKDFESVLSLKNCVLWDGQFRSCFAFDFFSCAAKHGKSVVFSYPESCFFGIPESKKEVYQKNLSFKVLFEEDIRWLSLSEDAKRDLSRAMAVKIVKNCWEKRFSSQPISVWSMFWLREGFLFARIEDISSEAEKILAKEQSVNRIKKIMRFCIR